MLSIDNSYEVADVIEWARRCHKALDPSIVALEKRVSDFDVEP
jgi:hypothetical protein